MTRTSGNQRDSKREGKKRQLAEVILRQSLSTTSINKDKLSQAINRREATTDDYLAELSQEGVVTSCYWVNPSKTRFCHKFRIRVKIDLHEVRRALTADRYGEAVEDRLKRFLKEWIEEVNQEHESLDCQRLLVAEATFLFGGPDEKDVELGILTDGTVEETIEPFVHKRISAVAFFHTPTTVTVGWTYSHTRI